MRSLSIGTTLGSFGAGLAPGEMLCDWAMEIENLGFDVLWFRDHVLWHSPVLDPFTALGAFAGRTSRIRLGTGVLLLPIRSPALVAKAVATLDYLSGGRAILGAGLGGEFAQEYAVCGVPLRERGRRANESIAAIKALWTTAPATFNGSFYHFDEVVMAPRPVQQPHPPIWVGGRSEAAIERAGKLGDGWLAYFETPEACRQKLDKALGHWHRRAATGMPFTGGLVLYFRVAATYEAARQAAVQYLSQEYQQPFEALVDKYCALGTVSDCVATVERFLEAGIEHVDVIPMCAPEAIIDQLREFAGALLPPLERRGQALQGR